ncbi:IucA/IucC family siderophore biosynthesis protein [Paracoccus nototheniae]|uniref:IucA/IucC family protein n=1 Tax=Paracoccus nototheniae TaxID=2489002 RepID=A0ABW4DZI8_9RHOB|nr:IucA/IucC family protein [Paracoccus nototheniae]
MTLSVPPCPTPSPRPDPAAETDPDAVAALASLRALLICQQRELGARLDHLLVEGGAIRIDVAMAMASGLPPLGALTWNGPPGSRAISAAEALEMILRQLGRDHGAQGKALARKTRASRARIATLVAARQAERQPSDDFLTAEQAVIFGHWMHPCPKTLSGMTLPEERAMTPDWRGALRLHALSVPLQMLQATAPDLARALPGMDIDPGPGRALLPAHPLTWDRARRDPQIAELLDRGAIRDLGPVGPGWWATSSVRTLWRGDSPWQIKASLPVTITNSQRVNKRHELLAGAAMSARTQGLAGRFGPLRLIGDPHWMTLALPDRPESGLEVILRQNPYRGARGGRVLQVAGLVAEPLPGRSSLLAQVMAGHDPAAWFDAYLDCAVAPLLRLYDATGIAVEAHQQNALLDLTLGLPSRCDIRDNQGFYVADDRADDALRAIPQLVYPRADAEDALAYSLIVNQVFGVIHRMALDGLWPEDRALRALAVHLAGLSRLPGHGGALAGRWLSQPHLPAKGNLLTQLGGVDELLMPDERAPMIRVPNPLPALIAHKALRHVA